MKNTQKEIRNDKNELVEYVAKKIVKKIGDGAYVLLPKELIGKEVVVSLIE